MRVFVVCTGRSGSSTFIRACKHIENFTSAHESASGRSDSERLSFPDQHIEADNHLLWFYGEMIERYGHDAHFVYLHRDEEEVAHSYNERWDRFGRAAFTRAFAYGLLQRENQWSHAERIQVCRTLSHTMTRNIENMLGQVDPERVLRMSIAEPLEPFRRFWETIGAAGDLDAALGEFSVRYNKRPERGFVRETLRRVLGRFR
jgi:hypothetical protein